MKRQRAGYVVTAVLVVALLLYLGVTAFFADLLISAPTELPQDTAARYVAEGLLDESLPQPEEIAIDTGDVTLAGAYYRNPAQAGCGALLLHGYTGNRVQSSNIWGPLFWQRGCDLLAYDARGHGLSSEALHTYGFYEKLDALTALNWLKARSGLQNRQVGVFGVSYGAAAALQMAPLAPDVAFIIADSSYVDLEGIVAHQAGVRFGDWIRLLVPDALWAAELRGRFDAQSVSPRDAVSQVTTPILLIHALDDAFTPADHSQQIYDNSNQERTRLVITDWGAEHAESILADRPAYEALVDDFLAEFSPEYGQQ